MQSKLIAISVAVLALFAGQAAHADASASVTVNNIKFWVYDMDLGDGETATASFDAVTGQLASTQASVNGANAYGVWNTLPNAASQHNLGANSAASVVGGGTLGSFTLQAQANSGNGRAFSYGQLSLNFTLSKNAMLMLSADVASSATTTLGKTIAGSEYADGRGNVSFQSWVNGHAIGSVGYLSSYVNTDAPGQSVTSGQMLAVFHNTSGASYNLVGNVDVHAQADIPFAPVPEPETYALLLAGLGALGLLQRRRRA